MLHKRKQKTLCLALLLLSGLVTACSSIDCPLNNTVYTIYVLKNAELKPDTLKDTLYVWTPRQVTELGDTVLLNRSVRTTTFSLPMSYVNDVDVLCFLRQTTKQTLLLDTVWVYKTNTPHFESVDCSPNYFHEITDVKLTHNGIDSIVIASKTVNYVPKDNFYIYFKSIK